MEGWQFDIYMASTRELVESIHEYIDRWSEEINDELSEKQEEELDEVIGPLMQKLKSLDELIN